MLYELGIRLYGFAIRIVSPFNPKARKWVEGRSDLWDRLPDVSNERVAWFHCASLGEFEQGRPVIEEWKRCFPEDFILVTFFSPSGYEVKKNDKLADYTCYLPLDTRRNARKFITHFKPHYSFFVKYEFWINHLKEAKRFGSKLYAVSAAFRPSQRFFKWYGQKFRKALLLFDVIFVQRSEHKELLNRHGINRVVVSGDTRYDRVSKRSETVTENAVFKNWLSREDKVLVVGSSWPVEEEILIPAINSGAIKAKVILAPHEVHNSHILEISEKLQVPYQCYTALIGGKPLNENTRVIILDCIGELANAYRYGNLAYVGGAFGTGLHNILEPATFGLPVIFGPKYEKFPEAFDFLKEGIAESIRNEDEFVKAYRNYIENDQVGNRAKEFIQKKKGATDLILSEIKKTLNRG
ncbi:MAG: glycosyltransferase N-terminal domain-containing protein [Brumimicrobium sp.]|nr:glycosyltransferase N-terminal domain-containing protein [Brumimicrobium sp.]